MIRSRLFYILSFTIEIYLDSGFYTAEWRLLLTRILCLGRSLGTSTSIPSMLAVDGSSERWKEPALSPFPQGELFYELGEESNPMGFPSSSFLSISNIIISLPLQLQSHLLL
jgi:hypothetical protein